ncbi:30S ribosomal protein S16 [Mycoplasmopsis cricetuli]|uniref:30S ribosomal protein S16 n=1 Tax=Mycoplasmopsis cricetuli TaxID=171283 RepID=UPI00046F1B10|nr:30S ribosomal protein S16 [Mycoplasmopsis cricetuli]
MVKIRLRRMGSKFKPIYKIVVADARAPRDGKFIEALGHYNPSTKELVLDKKAVDTWILKGAKPTTTVSNLFKSYNKTQQSIQK